MESDTFIGMGRSPDGVELPLGLSNRLGQDPHAMEVFGHMSPEQKRDIVNYIQGATSGPDAKQRIQNVVAQM